MRRAVIAGILLLSASATPALAGTTCKQGEWYAEAASFDAVGDAHWQYRELTQAEQKKITDWYYHDSHERIDYPHAWMEKSVHEDIYDYSVVFIDDNGCIQFRLNVTGIAK